MTGAHVPVALGDSGADSQVPVFPVHVVGARPGVVPQPNAEVLDGGRPLLPDLLKGDDFAVSLLDLLQLGQEVPVPDGKKCASAIESVVILVPHILEVIK